MSTEATAPEPLSPVKSVLLSSFTVGLLTGLASFCCCILGLNGVLTVVGAKRLSSSLPSFGLTQGGALLCGLISGSLASVVQITSALYSRQTAETLTLSDTQRVLFEHMLAQTLDSWTATWMQTTFISICFALIGAAIAWLWFWNSERSQPDLSA